MTTDDWQRYEVRDLDSLSRPRVFLFAQGEDDAIAVVALRVYGVDARHVVKRAAFVPATGQIATAVELDGGSGGRYRFTLVVVATDCVVRS